MGAADASRHLPTDSLMKLAVLGPEDSCQSLQSLLDFCKGRTQSIAEEASRTALQAISSLVSSCVQKSRRLSADTFPVLLEFLATWKNKKSDLAQRTLEVLEETIRNSRSSSSLPLGYSISKLAVDIAQEVEACEDTSVRACIFKTLFNVLTTGNVLTCDDNLRKLVTLTLAALADPSPLATDAQRFSLKIYAVCTLSPLSDDALTPPELQKNSSTALLMAASDVISQIQREGGQWKSAWECGSPGQTHLRVPEQAVLIFFATLPRLQSAFSPRGAAAADDSGNTVLHRLAGSNLGKCLEVYLGKCSKDLDLGVQDAAGRTPAAITMLNRNERCLEALNDFTGGRSRVHQSAALAFARASSVPLPPLTPSEEKSPQPSLSWVEPKTGAGSSLSREERLQRFTTQVQAQTAVPPSLEWMPVNRMASMSLAEGVRPPASSLACQPGGILPQASSASDERNRILQLALAHLGAGTRGDQADANRSESAGATGYLQNPAGNLPIHSNPFAGIPERHSYDPGSTESQLANQMEYKIPGKSVMRTSSVGSIGIEGSSPPHGSIDFRQSLSYDGRNSSLRSFEENMRGRNRSIDWESAATPSTRMWLGNIAAHVTVRSLYEIFGHFGQLTDAAVFPARIGPLGYAFVNFLDIGDAARAYDALNNTSVPPLTGSKLLKIRYKPAQQSKGAADRAENIGKSHTFAKYKNNDTAAEAMRQLDSKVWPSVSGTKPMFVRYPSGPPLLDPQGLHNMSVPGILGGGSGLSTPGTRGHLQLPPTSMGSFMTGQPSSELAGLRHLSLPVLPTGPSGGLAGLDHSHLPGGEPLGQDAESLLPAINLSNRLNPNNMHYDKDLAEMYKNMTKAEKEALWADDRSQQQLLAMQGNDQLPTDLSMLGLPPQQASLLANHLAGGGSLDPWSRGGQDSGAQQNPWAGSLPLQAAPGQQPLVGLSLPGHNMLQSRQQTGAPQGNSSQVLGKSLHLPSSSTLHLPPNHFQHSNFSEALGALAANCQGLQSADLQNQMMMLGSMRGLPPQPGGLQ